MPDDCSGYTEVCQHQSVSPNNLSKVNVRQRLSHSATCDNADPEVRTWTVLARLTRHPFRELRHQLSPTLFDSNADLSRVKPNNPCWQTPHLLQRPTKGRCLSKIFPNILESLSPRGQHALVFLLLWRFLENSYRCGVNSSGFAPRLTMPFWNRQDSG